ncbi:MAG TPA: hypothetical protein VKQ08_07425, partial [Cyclobacteriaceae bacterium]|nr:hypothetical protein [Cyclobacteriaceae bacterium]
DDQKNFLIAELKRLAPLRNANQTAVIVAIHHPVYNGNDAEKNTLGADLDDAFTKGGLWPDLVLNGHAHLYERFERDVNGRKMPYIVAGCGGYNLSPFEQASDPNVKVPSTLAQKYPGLRSYVKAFGYLKVKVSKSKLAVIFNCTDSQYGMAADSIVIDLKSHIVTEGKKGVEPVV